MIKINGVYLEVESKLAVLDIFQLILVQVRPPPYSGVNNVRESLPGGHLESPVQGAGDGDTLGWLSPTSGDGGNEGVQLISLLFQFLHQRFYCSLTECFTFTSLAEEKSD